MSPRPTPSRPSTSCRPTLKATALAGRDRVGVDQRGAHAELEDAEVPGPEGEQLHDRRGDEDETGAREADVDSEGLERGPDARDLRGPGERRRCHGKRGGAWLARRAPARTRGPRSSGRAVRARCAGRSSSTAATAASTSTKAIRSAQIMCGRCMNGASATTARASAAPRTSCSASAVPAIVEAGMLSPARRLRRASTATRASSPTRANRTELSRKPMKSAGTTWP